MDNLDNDKDDDKDDDEHAENLKNQNADTKKSIQFSFCGCFSLTNVCRCSIGQAALPTPNYAV